jgi:hypothetical protein
MTVMNMTFEERIPEPLPGEYYETQDYEPFSFNIDRILPEGLLILSADPKVGKTSLCMQMCEAITTGGKLFDTLQAKKGRCLCFLYESTGRAINKYIDDYSIDTKLIDFFDSEHSNGIDLSSSFPEIVDNCLKAHSDTRLIIVDTLDYAKGEMQTKSAYDYSADRRMMTKFHKLIENKGVTLLLVTHNRKEANENATKMISGTQGLTSATDGNLVMQMNPHTSIINFTYSLRYFPSGGMQLKRNENDLRFQIVGDNSELLRKDTPLTLSIKKFMSKQKSWSGSATELQKLLGGDCSEISINALGKELRKSAEDLFQMHRISLTTKKKSTKLPDGTYKSGRLITLKKA